MAGNEALLAHWQEQREQFRQSENQRAVFTNYVLVIAAAMGGLIVQQGFKFRTLPLSALIILIGLYGAVTVAKYHERATYHLFQARVLTRSLHESGVLADQRAALEEARQEHYDRYPLLNRLRLHVLWMTLHLGVAAYGVIFVVLTFVLR